MHLKEFADEATFKFNSTSGLASGDTCTERRTAITEMFQASKYLHGHLRFFEKKIANLLVFRKILCSFAAYFFKKSP